MKIKKEENKTKMKERISEETEWNRKNMMIAANWLCKKKKVNYKKQETIFCRNFLLHEQ